MPEPIELRAVIYPTLWQPLMVKGVPRDWAIFSVMVSAVFMMILGWFGVRWFQIGGVVVFVLMIASGWLAAKFDPEFFSIVLVRLFQIGKTKGAYHGNRYVV